MTYKYRIQNEYQRKLDKLYLDLQDKICNALEEADGKAKFIEDEWKERRKVAVE